MLPAEKLTSAASSGSRKIEHSQRRANKLGQCPFKEVARSHQHLRKPRNANAERHIGAHKPVPEMPHPEVIQQTRVYPYPLGAGSARPNPKMGAPDPENPLFLGFSVLREASETMVSDHGLGRGKTIG